MKPINSFSNNSSKVFKVYECLINCFYENNLIDLLPPEVGEALEKIRLKEIDSMEDFSCINRCDVPVFDFFKVFIGHVGRMVVDINRFFKNIEKGLAPEIMGPYVEYDVPGFIVWDKDSVFFKEISGSSGVRFVYGPVKDSDDLCKAKEMVFKMLE